ncbi:hypothetical protein [Novosphingobium sp. RL4]|uniref:hypothetical protein n=1 Tax=Novosphingobium sp. RL4 TaxID=3109595 RepID=UPI002D78CBD8|nr:hypothetical protein [Novosphingobium sp. RL4]WRT96019.1 hypothetical protein U9J33_20775 [Novosphingobium sp. RL4]
MCRGSVGRLVAGSVVGGLGRGVWNGTRFARAPIRGGQEDGAGTKGLSKEGPGSRSGDRGGGILSKGIVSAQSGLR